MDLCGKKPVCSQGWVIFFFERPYEDFRDFNGLERGNVMLTWKFVFSSTKNLVSFYYMRQYRYLHY
jgi:hypothetical protein